MTTRLALIPSPFLGAGSWDAVATLMPEANIVDYGVVRGPEWYEEVARKTVAQMDGQRWIAVLHSAAGGFAPAVAAAARNLIGLIFLDSVLPFPGGGWMEDAPVELTTELQRISRDGLLPPWNEWRDEDPTLRLISDPQVRAKFTRDLPRTPYAFLEAVSPDQAQWERLPAVYLQLSQAYEDPAEQARRRGWPVRVVQRHHLLMVSHPEVVAVLLENAAAQLEPMVDAVRSTAI